MAAGLNPGEFWEQTPRTFVTIIEGCARRRKAEFESMLSQAWHTEAFARTKKLPKLSDLLSEKKQTAQTPDQMLAAFRHFAGKGAPINFKQVN